MSTQRTFQDMLNEYLPNKLLKEELLKRTWMLDNIQRDDSWGGDNIIVPFRGSKPSSLTLNKLTASSSVHESALIRGSISSYQELWHALKLNFRDLSDHEGRVPEDTFLKVIPDEVEASMEFFKMGLNTLLINGSSFAKMETSANSNVGVIVVDKVDKFEIGQEAVLDDDNSSATAVFITAINIEASTVTLSATRGGATADYSAYTAAQNGKFYYPGAETASFTSLRSALLSSANGGSASLHSVSKLAYPFLQCVNVSGAAITEANILDKIFDALRDVQQKARGGKISVALMSLKNSASVLKAIQSEKGAFHVAPNSTKVSEYGWSEVMIGSPAGSMVRIVGAQEVDDDVIFLLDPKSMTFRSKGFIKKHKSPEGIEYFVERDATAGYTYIVDLACFGELEVTKPGNNGVIHSISY